MPICRRRFLFLSARRSATALPFSTRRALAQAYPTRTVRIIVGFPAGGNTDIAARIVAQWLSKRLGQQFVVENRPGAAANLAVETVVRSPADGYTLLAASSTNTINSALYDNLSFNFVNDIAMVAGIARSPLVLEVHPAVPCAERFLNSLRYVKANPGKITLASFGTGTVSHLTGELFKSADGVSR